MRQVRLAILGMLVACGACKGQGPSEANLDQPQSPSKAALEVTAAPDVASSKPPSAAPSVSPPAMESHGGSIGRHAIQTVFLLLMENHNWREVQGSLSAPYINGTLLPTASYAKRYFNPAGLHPSEPNYIWLEAGESFDIRNDAPPSVNHQASTAHLVNQLERAGISWKAYQEDIRGDECPLGTTSTYAPKHNPMIFFDDVTDENDPRSQRCIRHMRPYTELAGDLKTNKVARYNFITPNLCNDMHDYTGCATPDNVKNGDTWLAAELPKILASKVYRDGGAVFITWDEGEGSDGPIGMIVLSPYAKGHGYANEIPYTHSSMLRTLQEIFGVSPWLGDAANATDLGDLFKTFP